MSSPGNAHPNVVRQWDDGADGRSKLGLGAGELVVLVNIANHQGNNHQRKEVWMAV